MKKILIIALVVIVAFAAAACSKTPTPEASASPSSVAASAEIVAPSASASASASAAGNVSPTTGLPGNTEYRPVQVQIDNESTGRPQWGIQSADIVYEAEIEGGATRLSAIFNDTLPEKVGPVRSSRVYFQWIQNEWDSIYLHNGGAYNKESKYAYCKTADNGWDMNVNIDFQFAHVVKKMEVAGSVSESIGWDEKLGYTLTNVKAAEEEYSYERTERDPLFKFDSNVDYSKYTDFTKVGIPFTGSSNGGDAQVEYVYDKSTDLMTRYNFGDPFVEADTGDAVTVQNVIVQYVEESTIHDGADHQLIGMVGSGKAEFFVGGKHLTGTWEKADRHAGTVYKLDDGSDLVLKPGNTWIAVQRNTESISVDGTKTQKTSSKTSDDDD